MSNVYTTIIGVPKTARNKKIYGEGGSFSNSVVNSSVSNTSIVTPKDVISFTTTETPTISDYNTLYAPTHDQFPSVSIWFTVDGNNFYEDKQQNPLFTTVDGLIDTIRFETGNPDSTGFIILQ